MRVVVVNRGLAETVQAPGAGASGVPRFLERGGKGVVGRTAFRRCQGCAHDMCAARRLCGNLRGGKGAQAIVPGADASMPYCRP